MADVILKVDTVKLSNIYSYIYACIDICVCICICIYVYTYKHMCLYICIFILNNIIFQFIQMLPQVSLSLLLHLRRRFYFKRMYICILYITHLQVIIYKLFADMQSFIHMYACILSVLSKNNTFK